MSLSNNKRENQNYKQQDEEYWELLGVLKKRYFSKLKVKIEDTKKNNGDEQNQAEKIFALLMSNPHNCSMPCNMIFLNAVEKKLQLWLD